MNAIAVNDSPRPAGLAAGVAAQRAASRASVSIAIAGSGGSGVMTAGTMLLDAAARAGLYGLMVRTSGPQIRGGESAVVLRIAEEEVSYEGDRTDVLLCFRTGDLKRFKGSLHLHDDSVVVLEASDSGAMPAWIGSTKLEPLRHPFATLENGVEAAVILDGRTSHAMLIEMFTVKGAGTLIHK